MAKQLKTHADLFFVSLVAVVILAAAVIIIRTSSSYEVKQPPTKVEGVTTNELMKALDSAMDDGGRSDFTGLRETSSEL